VVDRILKESTYGFCGCTGGRKGVRRTILLSLHFADKKKAAPHEKIRTLFRHATSKRETAASSLLRTARAGRGEGGKRTLAVCRQLLASSGKKKRRKGGAYYLALCSSNRDVVLVTEGRVGKKVDSTPRLSSKEKLVPIYEPASRGNAFSRPS